MPAFLDSYEPLDIIGNGSFGIIRKVRRKSDGMVCLLDFLGLDYIEYYSLRSSRERN